MWLGEAARCGHLGYSAMAMLTFSIERGLTCTVNGSIGKIRCYRRGIHRHSGCSGIRCNEP